MHLLLVASCYYVGDLFEAEEVPQVLCESSDGEGQLVSAKSPKEIRERLVGKSTRVRKTRQAHAEIDC